MLVGLGRLPATLLEQNEEVEEMEKSDEPDTSDLDKLLSQCSSQRVGRFDDIYEAGSLVGSKKVGEGAFGEVYLVGDGQAVTDRPVLKVVPVGGTIPVNEEEQTTFAEMMSEVVISTALSKLRDETEENHTQGLLIIDCSIICIFDLFWIM